LVEVSALLEVPEVPAARALYFWALQAGFDGGGAAHLGLQWYAAHPGSTAVNWGGYDASGRVLDGTASALPSATGNPNTRDFPWQPSTGYRLRISAGDNGWRGEVTDTGTGVTTIVRELLAPTGHLHAPMVWSEVFARCDDPPVAVRWRGFRVLTAGGDVVAPDRAIVSYQSHAAGGCDNTTVRPDGDALVQVTNSVREVPDGAVLPLS
jgi:hypothetical protein